MPKTEVPGGFGHFLHAYGTRRAITLGCTRAEVTKMLQTGHLIREAGTSRCDEREISRCDVRTGCSGSCSFCGWGGCLQHRNWQRSCRSRSGRSIEFTSETCGSRGCRSRASQGLGIPLRPVRGPASADVYRGELTALVLGARLVKAWGGAENVIAAEQALRRIEAVLPADMRDELGSILLYAPGYMLPQHLRVLLDVLHGACMGAAVRYGLGVHAGRMGRRVSVRRVRWRWCSGRGVWTLVAWVRGAARMTSGHFVWTGWRRWRCWSGCSSIRRGSGWRTL